ncbi:hypothetical protein [Lysobacter gummosus]
MPARLGPIPIIRVEECPASIPRLRLHAPSLIPSRRAARWLWP